MNDHHTFDSPNRLNKKHNNLHQSYIIEEKIDDSQLSFTVSNGDIIFTCRNKEACRNGVTFKKSCDMIEFLHTQDNTLFNKSLTYHGESVCNKRHNIIESRGIRERS